MLPLHAKEVHGFPAYGLIDSAADITIVGGILFHKVVAFARLKSVISTSQTGCHGHTIRKSLHWMERLT